MSAIEFLRMAFDCPDDIPFQSNPANIAVSDAVNALSLAAPAFEPYFIKAFRDAAPRIRDDRAKEQTRQLSGCELRRMSQICSVRSAAAACAERHTQDVRSHTSNFRVRFHRNVADIS